MISLRLVLDTNIVVSAALNPEGLQRVVFQFLQLIRSRAHTVKPSRNLRVTSDQDDNKFLECAEAARADYLVTGNQKHFPRLRKRTRVITSREFLEIVAPHLVR